MNREEVERTLQVVMATMAASETPEWLRRMAFDEYWTLAMHLQWDADISHTGEAESGLMVWPGAYEYDTNELLEQLPDGVKSAQPVDMILARGLAKSADTQGHTVDARLEYVTSLRRTLQRLLCAAAASTESFDSLSDESGVFLTHLARIDPSPVNDEDETHYYESEFKGSTHGTH